MIALNAIRTRTEDNFRVAVALLDLHEQRTGKRADKVWEYFFELVAQVTDSLWDDGELVADFAADMIWYQFKAERSSLPVDLQSIPPPTMEELSSGSRRRGRVGARRRRA